MTAIDLPSLLEKTQKHISKYYSLAVIEREKLPQLKSYIEKFLLDYAYTVDGYTDRQLVDRLYSEMVEYSILTPYLGSPELEELNINGWDDIALTYTDGRIIKLDETFWSPSHAVDIVKRLLQHSSMIIDNSTPIAQGHLPNNTRITALKEPIVDEDRGIAVSIRLLHPQRVNRQNLIDTDFATEEMITFLETCIRYGVSLVVAGRTSSGKTTLLSALLDSIPNQKRIYTIESGARELFLVKRNENGKIINNVVHTLSRPSDNATYNITQEHLVVASLRFNPDLIVVGEIRNEEANSAVEASLTGHTVVSTVHSGPADSAHMRIALLCQRRFQIAFDISLMQAGQAFPVVVFTHKLEDNSRKIMDISECILHTDSRREYRTLYQYKITKNDCVSGEYSISGHFEKVNPPSESLKAKLTQFGVPREVLGVFG